MSKNLKRRIKPYTSSRIKTRNFLLNISYTGVKSEDFVDNNFTFDTITLITKNINPFSLERKIIDAKNRDIIIYKLWDECIEKTFYKHVCEKDNFVYLNSKNVLYSKTAHIVLDYLNKDASNIAHLRKSLQNHMKAIQFVYSRCFPEIYSLIDKRRIDLKSEFLLTFKLWKDKKKFLPNRINEKKSENEQALEKIIEEDEKVSKELKEKKSKRKALPEKNTALKEAAKNRRKSQPEATEKELWERLDTLNKRFKLMKDLKKQNKSRKNLIV